MNRKEFLVRTASGIVGIGVAGCSAPALRTAPEKTAPLTYGTLGKTGLKVTGVGFGATRTDQPSVMKRVVDLGVNFIDTGRMYAGGRNEELIGKVVRDIRKDIVLQSKFHRKLHDDPKAIEHSIEESLKALKTDYIDIMLYRWPESPEQLRSPAVEKAFARAKEKGTIRFGGFSCHENQAVMIGAALEAGFYDVALVAYNHAGNYIHPQSKRFYEWDQAALEIELGKAVERGMGIVAMKSCAGGPRKEQGESAPTYTASLRWLLENDLVDASVPAMANFRQVEEDVRAMEV